jgi:hypothetical protein
MNPFRRSLILVTSLALIPLAGVASAGQARPRSAPPASGSSSSGSSSGSSSSTEQGRSRTQAQPRESAPPQQQQSQRQEQSRDRQPSQSQRQEQQREREQVQTRARAEAEQHQREQQQRIQQYGQQNDDRGNNSRSDTSRQAIPAPRDRYIDLNRDGRNDNRESSVLGPQDRRDLERRYDNYYDRNSGRYDGRYDRYDNRYSNYSYRYNGPRVVFAPRQKVHFPRPWFSFRPLIRLPFGLTLGYSTAFPSWYRPYIVGRPGYQSPYMPYGGVTFDIEPRDAELWIDGEYMGRASDYSYNDPPLTLVAGSHYVELRTRYGRPLAFDITVIPGQVIPYQGTVPSYR